MCYSICYNRGNITVSLRHISIITVRVTQLDDLDP